jgi:hypothetical protein
VLLLGIGLELLILLDTMDVDTTIMLPDILLGRTWRVSRLL